MLNTVLMIGRVSGVRMVSEEADSRWCLLCARYQFFYDGNNRTGQLLMNGILLASGRHAITVSPDDLDDYFYALREWYDTGASRKTTRYLKDRQIGVDMDEEHYPSVSRV